MAKRAQNDHWAEKAKAMGYPARSIFKLEEILQKNNLVKAEQHVLDLGAAPGSWSLFLARKYRCHVVSCDLKALTVKHPLITEIQGNFLNEDIAQKIHNLGPYDVVVSDAAPATTGDRLVDCARSHELVEQAITLASQYLKKGGHLIVKVFQNGDEKELLERMKSLYQEAKVSKPKAVRTESFEVYFIGQNLL